jgi:D-threo-aldose 1-dehydrogenase
MIEKLPPDVSDKPCPAELMPITLIGPAQVRVPQLGLGGAPLASYFQPIPDQQAEDLICYALESGANFFDTAPRYGKGLGEQRLGLALQNVPRQSYALATKVGWLITSKDQMRPDFSRSGILRSLEESLERLGVERIDVVHLHDPDNHYRQALDEAFPTLADLRSQGLIGAIGAGMNQWQMLADFARNADFDCFMLAGRYSLLEHDSLEFLDLCQVKGIGVFLGGVYNTGILATGAVSGARYNYRPAPPEIMERVKRIQDVCASYHVNLRSAALQFPLAHPAVASVVVGAESREEFAQAFEGLCEKIPSELWHDLRDQGLFPKNAPIPGD